jgi:hypothetical protein
VAAVCAAPLSVSVIVTCAPTTTAPVESETLPLTCPTATACARIVDGIDNKNSEKIANDRDVDLT